MPCVEAFERQPDSYREEVLPHAVRRRVAIEAGSTSNWHRYTGLDGIALGIDRFGASGPGGEVFEALGMTAKSCIDSIDALLAAG